MYDMTLVIYTLKILLYCYDVLHTLFQTFYVFTAN